MTADELDPLRRALQAAPAPDPDARHRALAAALENFDALAQGQPAAPRPNPVRRVAAGFWKGIRSMSTITAPRGMIAATASVAVLAVGVLVTTNLPGSGPRGLPAPHSDARPPEPAHPLAADATVATPKAAASETADAEPVISEPAKAATHAPPAAEALADFAAIPKLRALSLPSAAPPFAAPLARMAAPPPLGDRFPAAAANGLRITAESPVSTYSVDVDTASWSWLRRSIRMGQLPAPDTLRIEEMINYFPYAYPAPDLADPPLHPDVVAFPTPWNPGTHLVRIGLQGRLPALADRPPLNLVFLVDTSGSMQGEDRLDLLKSAFAMLLDALRPEDRVAMVAYAGRAGQVLPPTSAADRGTILTALQGLDARGGTAGSAGLAAAYDLAQTMAAPGRVGRVILATDGDFNLGPADPDALRSQVAQMRASGVFLSVLGFGRGNLNDALMQGLAQDGNGQAAYIDTAEEARKVMVDQAAGVLFPIAQDVKIQVEWNPATVAEYRLIGYETRSLAREDFANDRVDAGEVGAGHQVTALYEITPVGRPARLTQPLRYAAPPATTPDTLPGKAEFGWLRLRYKNPGEVTSALIEAPIAARLATPDDDARFAAAIAAFGHLLTGNPHIGTWTLDQVIALAETARGEDRFGYRAEAIRLMRAAEAAAPR